jgi:hypothetical protein
MWVWVCVGERHATQSRAPQVNAITVTIIIITIVVYKRRGGDAGSVAVPRVVHDGAHVRMPPTRVVERKREGGERTALLPSFLLLFCAWKWNG